MEFAYELLALERNPISSRKWAENMKGRIRNQLKENQQKTEIQAAAYDVPSECLPSKLAPSFPMVSITMQRKHECFSNLRMTSQEKLIY